MDVVPRRQQRVEVARLERARLGQAQRAAPGVVDLLVLRAPIEADETPGEVVVDGRGGARRNDEREERERAVARAEEQPLTDAAAHAALGHRRLVLGRQPAVVGEELGEAGPDQLARVLGRARALDRGADVGDERPHDGGVQHELVSHAIPPA